MWMRLGQLDGVLDGHDCEAQALPTGHPGDDILFRFDGLARSELAPSLVPSIGHKLELVFCKARLERRPDLRIGRLTHSATQGIPKERAFIRHRLTFEAPVSRVAHRFVDPARTV